jgi:2-oxoglutarate ferredoxin oxidoreductase subunit gamma
MRWSRPSTVLHHPAGAECGADGCDVPLGGSPEGQAVTDEDRQSARQELADRYELRLAGEGGQGMILAGVILAEAAVGEGLSAVQTQSYGPEARGGASRSEVVLSRGDIDYPKVIAADALLCMSQESCARFAAEVKDDGLVIVDSSNVTQAPPNALRVPITQVAEEVTGRRVTASIVGLGLLCGLTGIVGRKALEQAVVARVPRGTEELNLSAVAAGFQAASELGGDNNGGP